MPQRTWGGGEERESMTLYISIASVHLMQPPTEAEEACATFEHLYVLKGTYEITQLERGESIMLRYK